MKRFFLPMIGMMTLLVAMIILGNFVPLTVSRPGYDQGCACMNSGISVYVDNADVYMVQDVILKKVATGGSYTLEIRTEGLSQVIPATMTWMPVSADNAKFTFDPGEVKDNDPNDKNPANGAMTVLFTVTAPNELGSYQNILSFQLEKLYVNVAVGSTPSVTLTTTATRTTSIPTDTSPLSEKEKYWLTYIREQEKLARDVYTFLGGKWDSQILKDMVGNEQRHMDAMETLLSNHKVPDPVAGKGLGVFANADLQKLYNDLTRQGSPSLVESLKVGVLVEEREIKDLKEGIANADHEDIKTVYTRLLNESEPIHLEAFKFELSKQSTVTPSESGWMLTTEAILIAIVAVAAVALVGAFFFLRRNRKK